MEAEFAIKGGLPKGVHYKQPFKGKSTILLNAMPGQE